MTRLPLAFVVFLAAVMLVSQPAQATFAASGQPCELMAGRGANALLAECSGDMGKRSTSIKLYGQRPNRVSHIDFTYDDQTAPFQVLKLNVQPLIDRETVAIMFSDFNFDDWPDLAVMRKVPEGPVTRYQYYLYSPPKKKFVPAPAMNDITDPEIDPANRQIRSYWQISPDLSGWNIWKWKGGVPVLTRRVEQRFDKARNCRQTTISYKAGQKTGQSVSACQ